MVFGATFLIVNITQNFGRSDAEVTEEQALAIMNRLYGRIRVNYLPPRRAMVELNPISLADTLPDISQFPVQVENTTPDYIEIFSSPEKASVSTNPATDTDRWLVDLAEDFNNSGATVNGRPVSVRLRSIASGTAMSYISSGKYVPDAYSPSNRLWGDALAAMGVDIQLVEQRLVGNVAGIVLTNEIHQEITERYGSVGLNTVVEAVIAGELSLGYVNPLASSAGVNFLLSTLHTFDSANPFSDTATSAFMGFQENIPLVAYTTIQMHGAAQSGLLQGFVFEGQSFMNMPELHSSHVFTPFGVRHDNPIYSLGQLSPIKQEILDMFVAFCLTEESQSQAELLGFNYFDDFQGLDEVNGSIMQRAQGLWNETKTGSRNTVAVFVADVSGSMRGRELEQLQEALLVAADTINPTNSIGLVTFSTDVNIILPIAPFDLDQRALFTGAVLDMYAHGSTAMFDAIVVASKMLTDLRAENPHDRYMMIVLTDGESNRGNSFRDTEGMIEGLGIPIFTIGYGMNDDVLRNLSAIHEAANIDADEDNAIYQIRSLFDAEM